MIIECSSKKLQTALDKASRATGKNLSLPVLSCIYLEADKGDGVLKIKSTNLDIGLNFSINVKCEQSGSVAIPAQIVLNLLNSIKDDVNLKISSKEGNITVVSKNNKSTIKCFPADDFPTIPVVSGGSEVVIKSLDFVNGIKSVWYSASTSGIKPELSSVYIYPNGEELVFVATDSFRLSEKRIYTKSSNGFQPILLPYKNIADILKILEGYNDDIKLNFDENQISATFGTFNLVSRVVDASFPDYKQIVPKSSSTDVTVLKNDLISTIKSAQVFSDSFNQVRIAITPKEKSLTLSTKNSDVGDFSESVPAKIDGDSLEISFNHKYIVDAMQSIEADSLVLSFSGMGKPMVISGVGDKSFTYILMPMNK